ncbi:MAG: hypothetical protein M1814_002151 [Vezdaea aestivalis]|nr:MAG: hypothetical protein M1814_002151 [Vezdaea aestivalis]
MASTMYPLGIQLGPRHITAAYALGEFNPVAIAKIEGSSEYRAFFAETLLSSGRVTTENERSVRVDQNEKKINVHQGSYNNLKVREIFKNALISVKEVAERQLHEEIPIGFINKPEHFNQSIEQSLFDTANEMIPNFSTWQILDHLNMARRAYGLDSCAGIGIDDPDCRMDHSDDHVVIFVELLEDSLRLHYSEVNEYVAPIHGQILRNDLGAKHFAERTWSATAFHEAFEALLTAHLHSSHPEDDWTFVRGIVVLADAPSPAVSHLREILPSAVPVNHRHKIRDSVDPNYVAAVGAAVRAREQIKQPRLLDPMKPFPLHDEL